MGMRFRTGLAIGFGAGYYLGAKAGRERYEQINRWLDRARASETYGTAAEKAKAAVDLGMERAKDIVGDRLDGGATPADIVSVNQSMADGIPRPDGEATYPSSR